MICDTPGLIGGFTKRGALGIVEESVQSLSWTVGRSGGVLTTGGGREVVDDCSPCMQEVYCHDSVRDRVEWLATTLVSMIYVCIKWMTPV